MPHQLGKAQNGVERGAQLVAHIGQKNAFGPAGRFGGLFGPAQLQFGAAMSHHVEKLSPARRSRLILSSDQFRAAASAPKLKAPASRFPRKSGTLRKE
jgi:hypothetical protein